MELNSLVRQRADLDLFLPLTNYAVGFLSEILLGAKFDLEDLSGTIKSDQIRETGTMIFSVNTRYLEMKDEDIATTNQYHESKVAQLVRFMCASLGIDVEQLDDDGKKITIFTMPVTLLEDENAIDLITISTEALKSVMKGPKLIKTWEELAQVPANGKYKIEIDTLRGKGWILPIIASDTYEGRYYLSTHTFYETGYLESTRILQECGFNVEIDNWDKENKKILPKGK